MTFRVGGRGGGGGVSVCVWGGGGEFVLPRLSLFKVNKQTNKQTNKQNKYVLK